MQPPVSPAAQPAVEVALPQPHRVGTFVRRVNRFAAEVVVDGETLAAHVPNSGRMTELMVAGQPVVVMGEPAAHRKTACDLVLIEYQGRWVSVDSRLPSAVAAAALRAGAIPRFAAYPHVRREVAYHDSRLDLELTDDAGGRALIETKSSNLVEDGLALFPDAPTTRGARHLHTLVHALQHGIDAGVLFIIQRDDAEVLRPFDTADPAFGVALRAAAAAGVAVLAYRCHITPQAVTLDRPVPVDL